MAWLRPLEPAGGKPAGCCTPCSSRGTTDCLQAGTCCTPLYNADGTPGAAALLAGNRRPVQGTLAQAHHQLLSIKQHSAGLMSTSLSASWNLTCIGPTLRTCLQSPLPNVSPQSPSSPPASLHNTEMYCRYCLAAGKSPGCCVALIMCL